MPDPLSRRDWLKVMGAAGAGSLLTPAIGDGVRASSTYAPTILPLTSTSDVFIPGRGQAFQKFSFDFPEPSVEFDGYRFGFLVFTRENAYGLDRDAMAVEATDAGFVLTCTSLVWAGGQERARGHFEAHLVRRENGDLEWDAVVEMDQPVKAVTSVVRGVPRGRISGGGGRLFDPRDNEILYGYPFGGGDLFGGNTARGISTPLLVVGVADDDFRFLSARDDRVRTKRFYLQPGETAYRIEAVFEAEGWLDQTRLAVPPWRLGRTRTMDDAVRQHYQHLERVYRIPTWEARDDVPSWLRDTALVITLHGMHYTGYVFNDYARMLEILRWTATRIPAGRVLVFLSAWDGRYYWDYPLYRPADRMGGADGFARLIAEGQRLGFRMMPMFGANAANRRQPVFAHMGDAATDRIDGDVFNLNWVDWDNDRHQEGWLAYMNLGVPSWRAWLTERIAETIDRFGVDAYFLDIVAGWVNNPRADMHEGTRRLVAELRARYPTVLACGEFQYDALLAFIPLYHVYSEAGTKYARFFQHLSHPAPGRGSTGVHEFGFGRWNAETLSLSPGPLPTLSVVDDTFTAHRDVMDAVITASKERAGIGP